jgi:hypothetical protein
MARLPKNIKTAAIFAAGGLIILGIILGITLGLTWQGIILAMFGIFGILITISPLLSFLNFGWKIAEKLFDRFGSGYSYREKANEPETEKRRRQFRLLNEQIFKKLREYRLLLPDEGDPVDLLRLNYDLSQLKDLPSYQDAYRYLNNDLPASTTRPEQLEAQAVKFNSDVNTFSNGIIPREVKQALQKVASLSPTQKGLVPLQDSISYENLIPYLERYWFSRLYSDYRYHYDFDCRYEEPYFWINSKIIAKIPNYKEDLLLETINRLKDYGPISRVINGTPVSKGLLQRRNELLAKASQLTKDINQHIIYRIEMESYHNQDIMAACKI